MRKRDVEIGGMYAAKVSGQLVLVRIDRPAVNGGWWATNHSTGRKLRIKSAARLRWKRETP